MREVHITVRKKDDINEYRRQSGIYSAKLNEIEKRLKPKIGVNGWNTDGLTTHAMELRGAYLRVVDTLWKNKIFDDQKFEEMAGYIAATKNGPMYEKS